MRDISAHDLVRTRLCAVVGCDQDAETGSEFCRNHKQRPVVAARVRSPEQKFVVQLLRERGPLRTSEIAELRGSTSAAAAMLLTGMVRRGAVVRLARGLYALPGGSVTGLGRGEAGTGSRTGAPRPAPTPSERGTASPGAQPPREQPPRSGIVAIVRARLDKIRAEIDRMERELLDALEDEAA